MLSLLEVVWIKADVIFTMKKWQSLLGMHTTILMSIIAPLFLHIHTRMPD